MVRPCLKIAYAAIAVFLSVGQPSAANSESALKKSAFELTIGYQCEKVLKDKKLYQTAKRNAVKLLGAEVAAKLIRSVESHSRDNSEKNKGYCRLMTEDLRKAR